MADLFNTETKVKEEEPTQEANTPAEEPKGDQPLTFKVGDREYDAEAATKKITEADKFIETLLQEKRSVQEQLEEAKRKAEGQSKLDELLELQRKQQAPSTEQPSQETPTVDQSELMELVSKLAKETYQTETQKESYNRNVQASQEVAKTVYGDSFADKLKERGQQLGMTEQEVQELAGSKPNVFKELFVPKAPNGKPSPNSSVNSAAVEANAEKEAPTLGRHFTSQTRVDKLREIEKYYKENPDLLNQ